MRKISFAIIVFALALSAGLALRAQLPHQVETWALRGTSQDSRISAAAVTLADGRTLIAGGTIDGAATNTVVLYDPATGSFSSAGQLLAARSGHTATLLEDGRVLIAGGTIDSVLSGDVELFDPTAGTSTLVATMADVRSGHAAARLPDGTVLIVGGTGAAGVLRSAEVFDPSTGTISMVTSTMQAARTGASATSLIDGRVLIAGGNDGNTDLASAEIYYAATQYFESTDTTLSVPRSGHAALLLPNNSSVLIAGGSSNGGAQASADLFVPAQFPDPYSYGMGRFASTGAMAAPRVGAVGAAGLDGYALAIGGGSGELEAYRFATIKTDKDDYAPGVKAIISGSGWQPNEQVTLLFQEDPAVHDDYLLTVTADVEGRIYHDQWAPEEHDLGVRFYLMASGHQSGRRAQTTFTDNVNVTVNDPGPVVWHRTGEVPGGFNVSVSGTYTCNTSGSAGNNCTSVTNLTITVSGATGSKVLLPGPGILTTPATGAAWGPVTLEFRTAPGVGQFTIPADGRPSVTATLNTNAPNSPPTGSRNNHFGVDNANPVTAILCNGVACLSPYSADVLVTLLADDGPGSSGSGVAVGSPQYCIDEANTCVPGTSYLVGGISVTFASGVTKYVRYRSTDVAGNVEETKSQQIQFEATTFDVRFNATSIDDVPGTTAVLSVTIGADSPVTVTQAELPKTFADLPTGTNVSYSYLSPLAVSATRQYRWLSTAGSGSASGQTTQSGAFSVTTDSIVSAMYKAQHLLTFNLSGVDADYTGTIVNIGGSPIASTSFVGNSYTQWIDNLADAPIVSWTPLLPSSVTGKRYAFLNATPAAFVTPVTAPQTMTATYQKQWRLTFNQSGVDGDYTGTVVTIGASSISSTTFLTNSNSHTEWINDGDAAPSLSWTDPLPSSVTGKQYDFLNTTPAALATPVSAPQTITANYQKQWRLTFNLSGVDNDYTGTVVTIADSPVPGTSFTLNSYTQWVNHGSTPSVEWKDPLASTITGKQYDFLGASPALILPVTLPQTLTATYQKQWQLTFNLAGVDADYTGTVVTIGASEIAGTSFLPLNSYSQWVNDGSPLSVDWEPFLASTVTGKRYTFLNATAPATPVTAAQTVTASYQKQWQLTFNLLGVDGDYTGDVVTIGGSPIPHTSFASNSCIEWIDNGDPAPSVTWANALTSSVTGKRYVLIAPPAALDTPVTAPQTMTANYKTQWLLTLNLSGVDDDEMGTVLTLGGTLIDATSFASNSYSEWVDAGPAPTVVWAQLLASSVIGKRYEFVSAASLSTPVGAPQTVIATYRKQWLLTLNLVGVDADYDGPVVTIGGTSLVSGPFLSNSNSYGHWVNDGSSPAVSWNDPLASTVAGKRYDFLGATPLGTTVNAPQTLTATYQKQWLLTWTQTGLAGTGSNPVVTVNASARGLAMFPYSEWFNDGIGVSYAFHTPISTDPASSIQFELTNGGSLPASPITVSGTMAINGDYSTNTYTIQYLSPLDQSEGTDYRINAGKNGRVVPVKVLLFKNGVPLSNTSTVLMRVAGSNCEAGVGTDPIEEYADAGASSGGTNVFRWSEPHWIYNLDTRALGLATNSCYRLDVYINAITGPTAIKASALRWAIFKPVK